MEDSLTAQSKIQQEVSLHKTPKESFEAEANWKANEAWAKEQNDFETMVTSFLGWILQRRQTTELIKPNIVHGDHGLQDNRVDNIVHSVKDYGFTNKQWNRRLREWEDISLEEINDYIDECIEMTKQPTLYGLLKHYRSIALEREREELAKNFTDIPEDERYNVFEADINTVEIDEQFDFIITDPPYLKEFLPLYETLAIRAKEWLKPTGLLIAMCGQSYFNQIMETMTRHLDYYWLSAYMLPGQPTPLRQRQVNCSWKPILILGNGNYKGKIFGDVYISEKPDKKQHEWGQSVTGMLSLISQICLPGQSILDPFLGAGTTGVASLLNHCLFTGFDIDEGEINKTLKRLSEV